jgi:hypothetical protein
LKITPLPAIRHFLLVLSHVEQRGESSVQVGTASARGVPGVYPARPGRETRDLVEGEAHDFCPQRCPLWMVDAVRCRKSVVGDAAP